MSEEKKDNDLNSDSMDPMISSLMTKMSFLGNKMKHGLYKGKNAAIKKMGDVPISAEDDDVLDTLDRYKNIKMKMSGIPQIMRTLYDIRMREAKYLKKLSHALIALDPFNAYNDSSNSKFNAYMRKIGDEITKLHQIQSEHLEKMEQELVIPFEEFRDVDIAQVEDFKVCKYKEGKMDFDLAAHKITHYQKKWDRMANSDYSFCRQADIMRDKIKEAQMKKDTAFADLEELRSKMMQKVDDLEKKKEEELLQSMKVYWAMYAEFVSSQNSLLSKNEKQYGNAQFIQGIVDQNGAVLVKPPGQLSINID